MKEEHLVRVFEYLNSIQNCLMGIIAILAFALAILFICILVYVNNKYGE